MGLGCPLDCVALTGYFHRDGALIERASYIEGEAPGSEESC